MKPWKWGPAAAVLLAVILVPFAFYGEAIDLWARGFIEGARGKPFISAAVLGGLLARTQQVNYD